MITQVRDGIIQPKTRTDGTVQYPLPHALLASLETEEPTCFSQASKHPHRRLAMMEEINVLLHNQTWSLVHPYPNQNIVGCKWVFRIKRNLDGSVEQCKARPVAK